jgi:toxin ParE1/3/4
VKVQWSPRALEQAETAFDYIAEDRPLAAGDWLRGLFERTQKLRAFPLQGRLVPEAQRADLREVIYGSYRIVYRVRDGLVAVLLVHHSRQEFDPEDAGDSE